MYPKIIRATTIHLLGMHYQKKSKEILYEALYNFNDHIRYNALQNLVMDDQKTLYQDYLTIILKPLE